MLPAMIGGFRSGLSITCKTDGNFENVSVSVLFSHNNENSGKVVIIIILQILPCIIEGLPFLDTVNYILAFLYFKSLS